MTPNTNTQDSTQVFSSKTLLNKFQNDLQSFTGELNSITHLAFIPAKDQNLPKDSIAIEVTGTAAIFVTLNGTPFKVHNRAIATYELKDQELAVTDLEIIDAPCFVIHENTTAELPVKTESLLFNQFAFDENPNYPSMLCNSTPKELKDKIKSILSANSEDVHLFLGIKLAQIFNSENGKNLKFKLDSNPESLRLSTNSPKGGFNELGLIGNLSVIFDEQVGLENPVELNFYAKLDVTRNPNNITKIESVTNIEILPESFKVFYKGNQIKLFKDQSAVINSIFCFNNYLMEFNLELTNNVNTAKITY